MLPLMFAEMSGGSQPVIRAVPILPDDVTLYPMLVNDADGLRFAVRVDDSFGYYCPKKNRFTSEYGMTGTDIRRCEYIESDGSQYITTDYRLCGDDTLKLRIYPTETGKNTIGCFSSGGSANYSFYLSTSSSYVRYNGSLYRNTGVSLNNWHDFEMGPTGTKLDGTAKDTWTEKTFTADSPMYICNLPNSSSAKYVGRIASVEVTGKHMYLPVKTGNTYRLMDILTWLLPAYVGSFNGGAVIDEDIPWPDLIE